MNKNEKVILPTNDLAFKKIFASPEYKDVLIGLINDFYNLDIVDVHIDNPYDIKEFTEQNNGYLFTEVDIICTDSNNQKYTIEMQLRKVEFFIERSLYYLFSKYVNSYGVESLMRNPASKYSALYPTYSINILDFTQFNDKKPIHKFSLYDLENKMKLSSPENIILGYFEIGKDTTELNQNLKYWKDFFTTGKVSENAPKYIKKAGEVIDRNNFSREERKMIDRMEKIREDAIAREIYVKNEGRAEGKAEGRAEGKAESRIEFATKLLKLHQSIDLIAETTELSVEEIEKLKRSIEKED